MNLRILLFVSFLSIVPEILLAKELVGCKSDYYIGNAEMFDQIESSAIDRRREKVSVHNFNYISLKYEDELASFNDSLLPMELCKESKKWNCVETNNIKLYIPKTGFSLEDSWEKDSQKYIVSEKKKVWLLGEEVELYILLNTTIKTGKVESSYYLTNKQELIGFTFFGDAEGWSQTYWLMEESSSFSCQVKSLEKSPVKAQDIHKRQ